MACLFIGGKLSRMPHWNFLERSRTLWKETEKIVAGAGIRSRAVRLGVEHLSTGPTLRCGG